MIIKIQKKYYLRLILFFILLGICSLFIGHLYSSYFNKAKTVVVEDAFNRNVKFIGPPRRVVCLVPSLTDIIFSLGLGRKIIGVSEFCDLSSYKVAKLPQFNLYDKSEIKKDEIEGIVNLKPDIVFLWVTVGGIADSDMIIQVIEHFEKENIMVLIFKTPKNIEEIFQQIKLLGDVFSREERAEKLINKMKSGIEQATAKTRELIEPKRLRVYVEIQENPIITLGGDNYFNQILELAGGKNIFEEKEGWPVVMPNEVIIKDPEVILFYKWESFKYEILKRENWQGISAVKEGRIYELDAYFLKRYGPGIVEGLRNLVRLLHPELFTN